MDLRLIGADSFVIEIKSFRGLVKRLGRLVKPGSWFAQSGAVRQVLRQGKRLKSLPVLWCPVAQFESAFVFQGILVVNGSDDELMGALRWFANEIERPYVVQFNDGNGYPPSYVALQWIKERGFRYFEASREWYGVASKSELQGLRQLWPDTGFWPQ